MIRLSFSHFPIQIRNLGLMNLEIAARGEEVEDRRHEARLVVAVVNLPRKGRQII